VRWLEGALNSHAIERDRLVKEVYDLRTEIERLKTENAALKRMQAALETWHAEGEQFFGDKFITFSFRAGEWWADRPWRKRDEL